MLSNISISARVGEDVMMFAWTAFLSMIDDRREQRTLRNAMIDGDIRGNYCTGRYGGARLGADGSPQYWV